MNKIEIVLESYKTMAYHFIDSYILAKQNWFSAKLLLSKNKTENKMETQFKDWLY